MPGLLDFLGSGSGGGGLLDILRQNASAAMQQFPGAQSPDQPQYGAAAPAGLMAPAAPTMAPAPTGSSTPAGPSNAMAQMPPVPQAAMAPSNPGGFGAGISGFFNNLHTGPIGALIGGIGSAAGLEDPGVKQTRLTQNLTARALLNAGVPQDQVIAAIQPGNSELLKTLITNNIKEKQDYRPATPEERKAAFGGNDNGQPLFIETNTNKPTFGPATTNVNVSTEKTGQAELAKTGVESYVAAQNAGRDAQKRVAMYDTFEKAAQGFTPGASAEMRLAAKRYLKDAGLIRGEDVPDGEVMQMISRQLGVHAQPKGQGAVSNYERELFAKSLPNMTQSPEGLKQAIDISRKLEQFDQKVAEIYRESAKANKGLPNYLEVQEKIAALGSPLSDGQMAAISGGQAQPTTAAPPAPAASSNTGWTNIGNGVKIRPK
jgi:hypothetical protein